MAWKADSATPLMRTESLVFGLRISFPEATLLVATAESDKVN